MSDIETPHVDTTTVARLRELGDATGEPTFVAGLVDEFETSSTQRLIECARLLSDGDLTALERAGHSMKGSSGTIGAMRVRELSAELERAAREGDADACALFVAQLNDALPLAVQALRAHA